MRREQLKGVLEPDDGLDTHYLPNSNSISHPHSCFKPFIRPTPSSRHVKGLEDLCCLMFRRHDSAPGQVLRCQKHRTRTSAEDTRAFSKVFMSSVTGRYPLDLWNGTASDGALFYRRIKQLRDL
jgi:hypothetical protein